MACFIYLFIFKRVLACNRLESWLHGVVFVLQHAGDNRTVPEAYKRHSKQATANGTKHAGYLYMPTPLK